LKRFGVTGHLDRPQIKKITEKIIHWAADNDIECRICTNLAAALTGKKELSVETDEIWKYSDVLISLGGDGSMLSSARVAGMHDIPILGINLGSLGFLTEISEDLVYESLQKLKKDDYKIEDRMMHQSGQAGFIFQRSIRMLL
jgi:NAD+ kinase